MAQYIVEIQRNVGSPKYTFESFIFEDEEAFRRYLLNAIDNFKANKKSRNMSTQSVDVSQRQNKYHMEPNPSLLQMVSVFRRKKNWRLKFFSIQKIGKEVIIQVNRE